MSFYYKGNKLPFTDDTDPSTIFTDGIAGYTNEDGEVVKILTRGDVEMLVDCYGDNLRIDIHKIPLPEKELENSQKESGDNNISELRSKTYSQHGYSAIYSVCFSTDGSKFVSVGRDKRVVLYNTETDKVIATHAGGKDFLLSTSYSPVKEQFLVGSGHPTIRLFDSRRGIKEIESYKVHSGKVYSVNFFQSGTSFVSGSMDGTSKVVDVVSKKVIASHSGKNVFATAIVSPNVVAFAEDSPPHSIKNYDIRTGNTNALPTLNGHTSTIWSVESSANGTEILSTGMDGQVLLFDVRTGNQRLSVSLSTSPSHHAVFFGPNEKYFISCGRDVESIAIWNTGTGAKVTTKKMGSTAYHLSCYGRQTLCCTLKGVVERITWANI